MAKTSTAPAKGSYDFECELWQHKILSAVESGRFSIVGEFPYITPSGANSGKMITRLLDTAENGLAAEGLSNQQRRLYPEITISVLDPNVLGAIAQKSGSH